MELAQIAGVRRHHPRANRLSITRRFAWFRVFEILVLKFCAGGNAACTFVLDSRFVNCDLEL
ncbi:MAG: hypothetical protein DMF31_05745 [Verrucomicrobia bacterium]|nr:MAG: hypothetical protein DME94_06750 [Verrucomicrobiota bacterium]PYL59861.1 MAG: hypothetical protein DMF31_05745 [Verrucomicrobiota bacterium]